MRRKVEFRRPLQIPGCGVLIRGYPRLETWLTSDSVTSATQRRELLKAVYDEARLCVRCPLHQTRTQVVFGAGNADAELMFVGEAPGANEDRQGLPFVGQAGKLLEKLLEEIGLSRQDVFICNVLKCRPPNNRDPQPNEIHSCEGYLRSQVELIEPTMICTLGNFATKLLRSDTTGISRLHGQEEELTIGTRKVRLYPLYHPAAALYTPATLEALRADFHRIPELLALGAPNQPEPAPELHEAAPELDEAAPELDEAAPELEPPGTQAESPAMPRSEPGSGDVPADQLGLF
jgi:uracil-DNA glycosylase family 4